MTLNQPKIGLMSSMLQELTASSKCVGFHSSESCWIPHNILLNELERTHTSAAFRALEVNIHLKNEHSGGPLKCPQKCF